MTVPDAGVEALGLLVILKKGADFEVVVIDSTGHRRPEWIDTLLGLGAPAHDLKPGAWKPPEGWENWVRDVLGRIREEGKVVGVASFVLTN